MTALNAQTDVGTVNQTLSQADKLPGGQLAGLSGCLAQWPELDIKTLGYHLEQSDALAAEGYCHAAVHEACSFLEALVQGMALAVRGGVPEKFQRCVDSQARLRLCRDSLFGAGYLDAEECRLLVNVFDIVRAKGSHAGIADEAWCRLGQQFVRTTADYLIGRYAAWRSVGFTPVTPSVASPPVAKPVETAAA